MSAAIGIDLGSSKCCTYVVNNGELEVIPSATGTPTIPSWVGFTADKALVGAKAREQAASNPSQTVFGIKRLLGRKFYAPETTWLKEALPVQLVPAANGDAWFEVGGTARSPQELVSYLLEHIKTRAEIHLKRPVSSAVIAVPSFFDVRQRRVTLEAAQLAGLRVERLLHAPTAAAIAQRHRHPELRGRWVVLDLGAGGLDVSVIDVGDHHFEVLSAVGDPLLGGDDFDRRIVERLIDRFYELHGIDLADDASAMHRLFEAARTAKHEMSHVAQSSAIQLPMIARTDTDVIALDDPGMERTQFEELIAEELDRIAEPCALALEDLGFGTDDMSGVLLLGGMARMPAVQQAVTYLYRTRPTLPAIGPSITAMGAALYAASIDGTVPEIRLDEVAPQSIGIKIRGGRFSPLIHRRSIVPCREQKVFTAARREQAVVSFEVYQGESELVNENVYLGRFEAPSPPDANQVVVAFGLDANGVLAVSCGTTRADSRITLQASSGLSDDDIQRLRVERNKRSRIIEESARHLAIPYHAAARSSAPPARDSERPKSLRPGPRRSMPPAATAVVKPRQLPQHSVPPPATQAARLAAGNAATKTPGDDLNGAPGSAFPVEIADDPLIGTTVGGRYIIDDIVADGGMGRVYVARHDVLNKKFALKVLHPELAQNEELAARFVREAQSAAQIDSPHVIDILDFGRLDDGTGYFVMEYLSGTTLAQLIHDRGALSAKLLVDIATQLTEGLIAAHAMGIVHRDLKPDNVTLIQRGGHPHFCKILDFGIAKAQTSDSQKHETLAGTLLGTPHYMAPEQIDGVNMDARCDIYSLGAVMYEMATGKPPFDAETLVGVLVAHKTEEPVPVRSHDIAADCPIELQAIIHRCLAKSPDDRFASAEALNQALRAPGLAG